MFLSLLFCFGQDKFERQFIHPLIKMTWTERNSPQTAYLLEKTTQTLPKMQVLKGANNTIVLKPEYNNPETDLVTFSTTRQNFYYPTKDITNYRSFFPTPNSSGNTNTLGLKKPIAIFEKYEACQETSDFYTRCAVFSC